MYYLLYFYTDIFRIAPSERAAVAAGLTFGYSLTDDRMRRIERELLERREKRGA